jgi:hypothetical protein
MDEATVVRKLNSASRKTVSCGLDTYWPAHRHGPALPIPVLPLSSLHTVDTSLFDLAYSITRGTQVIDNAEPRTKLNSSPRSIIASGFAPGTICEPPEQSELWAARARRLPSTTLSAAGALTQRGSGSLSQGPSKIERSRLCCSMSHVFTLSVSSLRLLYPVFALVLLSFIVLTVLGVHRFRGIARRQFPRGYFRVLQRPAGAELPERAEAAARNLINLFELPVLFYALVPLLLLTGVQDDLTLALSYAFVGLRYLHSAIHLSVNKVTARFGAYLASSLVLLFLWVRFAVLILTTTSAPG